LTQTATEIRTVFVHGLGSNSEKTWVGTPALPEVAAEILQTEPLFYDYPTKKLRFNIFKKSKPKIQDLSQGLRSFIELRAPGAEVVLVCHSMGGLVAKKMLVDVAKQISPVVVKKLLLFGTPNTGSELADLASMLSLRNFQLEQLSPKSEFIEELNRDWQDLAMAQQVDTHYVVGGEDTAVAIASARGQWGGTNVTTVIGADHSGVAAPDSREHLGAARLRFELSDLIDLPEPDANANWLEEAQRLASRGLVTQADKAFERASANDDLAALHERAKFLRQIGRLQASYDLNQYMIDLPAWIEDNSDAARSERALVIANMGVIKRKQQLLDDSEIHLREAVNTASGSNEEGMWRAEAYCRDNLGHTLLKQSRPEDALREFQKALDLREGLGEDAPIGRSHLNVARQYMALGKLNGALDAAASAISLLVGIESERRNLANAYICLGEVQLQQKQFAEAAVAIRQGIDVNEEIQNRDGAAIGWMKLGQAHRARGSVQAATRAFDRSMNINEDLGNLTRVTETRELLAELGKPPKDTESKQDFR